jgi:penicillin-binding protein 1A
MANWGEVSLADMMIYSRNVPAVYLAKKLGMSRVIAMAERLGISSTIRPDLTSALGSSEVSLLELTAAYSVLAHNGVYIKPWGIIPSSRHTPHMTPVLSPHLATMGTTLLKEVVAKGTGKVAALDGIDVAGKTGTTQDNRDAWFIGYHHGKTVGVWLGNDDNTPMDNVSGGTLPATVWKKIME